MVNTSTGKRFRECPDVLNGFHVAAIWVTENSHWYAYIETTVKNDDGKWVSDTVYSGHYTADEGGSAYQAAMLALSDWHNGR